MPINVATTSACESFRRVEMEFIDTKFSGLLIEGDPQGLILQDKKIREEVNRNVIIMT